jgi:hypothetical protein
LHFRNIGVADSSVSFCAVTQALAHFGEDIAIAFSGAEDVALIEYAHLTGRKYRVFRWGTSAKQQQQRFCCSSRSTAAALQLLIRFLGVFLM